MRTITYKILRWFMKFFHKEQDKNFDVDYWNNKWKKNSIIYKARGNYTMDVRNLILNKSVVLEPYTKTFKGSYDDKALAILKGVKGLLKYQGDIKTNGLTEHWENPEITFQKRKGDCEDGALLIASLMRIAGIPAYRIKVCAGWVKTSSGRGGHAYCIYLADDNKWYIGDWCYYGNDSINNFKKVPHSDNKNYEEIWWTFNDIHSWSQKSTTIGGKK